VLLQFFNDAEKHMVVCDWEFPTGRWTCGSTLDHTKICDSSRDIVRQELQQRGYSELSTEEPSWDEKRCHPRKPANSRCKIFLNTGRRRTPAQPLNISRGGALVTSPIPLERGHKVALVVDSGSLALRELEATVRHATINEEQHHFVLGIEFDHPLDESLTDW